jgi:hypothetical protein
MFSSLWFPGHPRPEETIAHMYISNRSMKKKKKDQQCTFDVDDEGIEGLFFVGEI